MVSEFATQHLRHAVHQKQAQTGASLVVRAGAAVVLLEHPLAIGPAGHAGDVLHADSPTSLPMACLVYHQDVHDAPGGAVLERVVQQVAQHDMQEFGIGLQRHIAWYG
jgi:hypothetical protein